MVERERDEPDFAERAADATEESRRQAGEEGRTIEDQPESGRLSEGPREGGPDPRV